MSWAALSNVRPSGSDDIGHRQAEVNDVAADAAQRQALDLVHRTAGLGNEGDGPHVVLVDQ